MPRARISENGIEIAKPGYDVDTASLANMILTPQFSTMRVVLADYVTVASYTGDGSDAHDRAYVSFASKGLSFTAPPMVLAAGYIDANTSDQTPFTHHFQGDSGRYYIDMHYCIETSASGFYLYVYKGGSGTRVTPPRTWKYFVFANRGG